MFTLSHTPQYVQYLSGNNIWGGGLILNSHPSSELLYQRGRQRWHNMTSQAGLQWSTVSPPGWGLSLTLLCCPCSIALDPLYPSRCSWETFGYATSTTMTQASDELTPLQLSGQLNSLPCSMSFRQEESTSIIRLIEQVSQAHPPSSSVSCLHPAACSS